MPRKPAAHGLHSHVPEREAVAVLVHARRCLVVLRMAHWDVELADAPADLDTHASTRPTGGRYITTLYLPTDWCDKSEVLKRRTLMHEMLHAVHAQQEQGIRTTLQDCTALSRDVWDSFIDRYRLDTEYMVDQLTHVLDDVDAIPAWPTREECKSLRNVEATR